MKRGALVILTLMVACNQGHQRRDSDPVEETQARTTPLFEPALTQVVGGGDPLGLLVGSEGQCGRCHEAIFEEWQGSAHAHASRSNPFYRRAFERFVDEAGPDRARLCAACHEPALLLGRDIVDPDPKAEATTAGVGCMACHGVVDADRVGNGAYTWSGEPVQVPVEGDYKTLGDHMARVGGAALRSEALCASCHRAVLEDLPGFEGHLPGVDEVTSWEQSVYREGGLDGLGEQVPALGCASCHMPFEGRYRGHRFAGGHATLAAAMGDGAQLRAVEANVKGALEVLVGAAPDDERAIDVVVFNTRVGHDFPGGASDLRDVWIEVGAWRLSLTGEALGRFYLGARALDEAGERLLRHEVARFRKIEALTVPPRGALLVRFRLPEPWSRSALGTVHVRLLQRRLNRAFQEDACSARRADEVIDPCFEQPILEVAGTHWNPSTPASARLNALRSLTGGVSAELPLLVDELIATPTTPPRLAKAPRSRPHSPPVPSGPQTSGIILSGQPQADTIRAAYGNDAPGHTGTSGRPLGDLLAHLDAISRASLTLPSSLQWRFEEVPAGQLGTLLAHPALAELTHLDLHGLRTDDLIQVVKDAPFASRLISLSLGGCRLTDTDIDKLAVVSSLVSMRELHLSDNQIGDRGITALLNSPFMPRLEHLNLRRNHIGPSGARALSESVHTTHLRTLNLGWNRLGDEGTAVLTHSKGLTALTHLDLGSNDIGPAGAKALGNGPLLKQLESLSLWRNLIRDEGAAAILASPSSASLSELDISLAGLTPASLVPLKTHTLPSLKALFAYGNAFGPAGCTALASTAGLPALEHLEIGNNAIGDAGLSTFAQHSLTSLRELVVWRNGITDEGVAALSASQTMGALTHLNLFDNNLGPTGIRAVLDSPHRPQRATIKLSRNRVGTWLGQTLGEAHAARPWPVVSPWDGQSQSAITEQIGGGLALHLDDNPLGDEGVAALVVGARTEIITHLSLNHQGLTDDALRTLAQAPRGWASLSNLDVRGNRFSQSGLEAIESLMKAAPKLSSVDVALSFEAR